MRVLLSTQIMLKRIDKKCSQFYAHFVAFSRLHVCVSLVRNWKLFFLFLKQKTYVVGNQKNRLNETVLLST